MLTLFCSFRLTKGFNTLLVGNTEEIELVQVGGQ